MDKTLRYYEENAESYIDKTFNVDVSENWGFFEDAVRFTVKNKPVRIMDLGCASCRDTLHFQELGWDVVPVDGSAEFVRLAKERHGIDVLHIDFDSLDFVDEFDAVWAMSSLHHSTPEQFKDRLRRVLKGMKSYSVLYFSVLEGERGYIEDEHGRIYLTLEPSDLIEVIDEAIQGTDKKFRIQSWTNPHVKLPYNWLNAVVEFYEG